MSPPAPFSRLAAAAPPKAGRRPSSRGSSHFFRARPPPLIPGQVATPSPAARTGASHCLSSHGLPPPTAAFHRRPLPPPSRPVRCHSLPAAFDSVHPLPLLLLRPGEDRSGDSGSRGLDKLHARALYAAAAIMNVDVWFGIRDLGFGELPPRRPLALLRCFIWSSVW